MSLILELSVLFAQTQALVEFGLDSAWRSKLAKTHQANLRASTCEADVFSFFVWLAQRLCPPDWRLPCSECGCVGSTSAEPQHQSYEP